MSSSAGKGRTWRFAVSVIFALSGAGLASWLSRMPDARDSLGATTIVMSFLILALSAGSIAGLVTAGAIARWCGPRGSIFGALALSSAALALVGVGCTMLSSLPIVLVGLALFGYGNGVCNVVMNVEAAAVERLLARSVMPAFHATFSLGLVIGAGAGALATFLSLPIGLHFAVVGLVLLAGAGVIVPLLRPDPTSTKQAPAETPLVRVRAWREPRTILIGIVVLGFSFGVGAASDWAALAMIDGHGADNATGAAATTVFVVASTITRFLGGRLLDHFGRVKVLRASAGAAILGILLFVLIPGQGPAFAAVVLWGAGSALGFPVGMSAAGDDPRGAAQRIGVVATIGYGATIAGPLSIGFAAESVGLLHALLVVLAAIAASGFAASVVGRPADNPAVAPAQESLRYGTSIMEDPNVTRAPRR